MRHFFKRKCDNYCGADILYELWLQDQNKTTNLFQMYIKRATLIIYLNVTLS